MFDCVFYYFFQASTSRTCEARSAPSHTCTPPYIVSAPSHTSTYNPITQHHTPYNDIHSGRSAPSHISIFSFNIITHLHTHTFSTITDLHISPYTHIQRHHTPPYIISSQTCIHTHSALSHTHTHTPAYTHTHTHTHTCIHTFSAGDGGTSICTCAGACETQP